MAAVSPIENAPGGDPKGADTSNGVDLTDETGPPRIQVSFDKKPLYFYVNLAKKLLGQNSEVKLSALGFAMQNVVAVAQILKKENLVEEKQVSTTIDMLTDRGRPRAVRKPKLEIVLVKSADFDAILEKQAKELLDKKEKASAEEAAAGPPPDSKKEGENAPPSS